MSKSAGSSEMSPIASDPPRPVLHGIGSSSPIVVIGVVRNMSDASRPASLALLGNPHANEDSLVVPSRESWQAEQLAPIRPVHLPRSSLPWIRPSGSWPLPPFVEFGSSPGSG